MINKIIGYIGFAIRGKYIFLGEDNLVKLKPNHALFVASDASENTLIKAQNIADKKGVKIIRLFKKSELGQLLNKENVAILIITNYSLAAQINKIYQN